MSAVPAASPGRRRVAVLQSGGPTAVLNSSLHAFAAAAPDDWELRGVLGGPTGLLAGTLVPLDRAAIAAFHQRAGALLGAGRQLRSESDIAAMAKVLVRHGVDALVVIGGNGSMALADRIEVAAHDAGAAIDVVGVPKTVDNDLVLTDRAPGFSSAANFFAMAVRDLEDDQRAMGTLEDVRIVESIGRDVGWVAFAAHATRRSDASPRLVFVPEMGLGADDIVERIVRRREANGPILVVVAEGVAGELTGGVFQRPPGDRPLRGGVARVIASRLEASAGYVVRAEVLGMIQRCATCAVTDLDRGDASAAGASAARALEDGASGVMVTLVPRDVAGDRTGQAPLRRVAEESRPIPVEWLGSDETGCSPEFLTWLRPLLSAEAAVGTAETQWPVRADSMDRGERR